MITKQKHEEQTRAAAFNTEREQGLQAVYAHFRNIKPCDANKKHIFEICDDWAGEQIAPSVVVLDLALQENPELVDTFAIQHINEQRQDLIQVILYLLESKNEGRDGLFSKADLRFEKIRMASWSREKLQARVSEIESKQAQSKLTVPQLQKIVRDGTQVQRKYAGYPNLPDVLVMPGQVSAQRIDSKFLLNLARTDYYEYKRLCSKFSTQQITDRQQGRS